MSTKPTLHLLFSHKLTEPQEKDAYESLRAGSIVYFPEELLRVWGSIPPEAASIKSLLMPHAEYMSKVCQKGDYILIQGDPGATFLMVQKALSLGLQPVYATTSRAGTKERRDAQGRVIKSSVFEHVRYRVYGQ